MQYALAGTLLASTLIYHYGFWWAAQPVRFHAWMGGMQGLALLVIAMVSVFKRWTNWKAVCILIAASAYNVVEYGRTAICGGWYNFAYSGPPIYGDRCEVMTGLTLDKAVFFSLTTTLAIALPTIWKNKWGKSGNIPADD